MTFISHLHFPATAFPPSFMHIFLLLKPGRNNVSAGLAEPLMGLIASCQRQPGCTWMSHRFPGLSCLQDLPLLQDRHQPDHQGDWGASCQQPTGAGSLFTGPERKITPLGISSILDAAIMTSLGLQSCRISAGVVKSSEEPLTTLSLPLLCKRNVPTEQPPMRGYC